MLLCGALTELRREGGDALVRERMVKSWDVVVRARVQTMLPEVEDHVAQALRHRTPTNWTGIQSTVCLVLLLTGRGLRAPLNDFNAAAERQCAAIAEEVAAGEHDVVADAHRPIVAKIFRVAAAHFRQQYIPGCSALVCEHDREDAADGFLKSRIDRTGGRDVVVMRHCAWGQRVSGDFAPEELARLLPVYEARGFDCSKIRRHIAAAA